MLGAPPWVVRYTLAVPSEHKPHGCVQETIEPVYLHRWHQLAPWSCLNSEDIVLRGTQTNGLWEEPESRLGLKKSCFSAGNEALCMAKKVELTSQSVHNSTNLYSSIKFHNSGEHVTSNMNNRTNCPGWWLRWFHRSFRHGFDELVNRWRSSRSSNSRHGGWFV